MADTKQLTSMLKQLGWGSGFRLPISNEENTKLEQLLEMKQSRLVSLSLELQEVSAAVDNSTSFMKNLNSKLRHAKDVESAKRSQMEKERHFLGLAERDHAKTEQDVRKMEKRLKAIKERNKQLEENVLRRKDALGELVDVINFDKKAISAYEDKFNKEDAYLKLIEDFADTDNEKLKKCRDEYQQLGEKVANSKVYLNQTLSETDIMEGELEELAKRFRRAHAERNQSIENWKKTLEVLEDRDEEIMEISAEYQKASLEMKKKLGMLETQERFYENIQAQTRCYEGELGRIERNMSLLHKRKRETESQIDENSDSVSELVGYIVLTDKEMRTVQTKLREMGGENDGWKKKLETLSEELESLKAKYEVVTMETLTSNEHTKQLQDFLEKEEKKAETLAKELSKQITWKSQRENQAKEMVQEVALAESQVKNVKAAIARNRKQCIDTEDRLFKTNTAAYRLDLKAMNLMVKVRGLENPETLYSREEYEEIQRQIACLKETCDEQIETQTQIKLQISHCDRVNHTCQKELQKEKEQKEQFEFKLHKLDTEIKSILKDDELFLENIKDMGVNNSLLHVQLRRMIQSIKTYETKMFDLEQQRITMQMAVKERKKDIEIYTSLLLNKKRSLQDESLKLKMKCHDVSNDVQARKRKYEMVMGQMWARTDSEIAENDMSKEGRGRSEAYYIIKLAQEREHYRQEGDKWDERVKEAEKVVEGLQNTLALMMGTNEAFKDSLKPATDSTDEGRQLKELKQKELDAARNLKGMKDTREKCSLKLRQMQFQLDKFIAHKAEYEHELMEKQYELQGIIGEINGQKEKIQRATQQANKLVRELSKLEALDAELLQNDLRLRVTKEKYEFAVLTLEKLLQTNTNLITETLEFLHAKGMEGLVGRITRKLISPSLASTPHQSGRSTPYSSRSVGSRRTFKSSLRVGTPTHSGAIGDDQAGSRRSTQKSVVFETLTSTPSTKKMLSNIAKGLEAHRKTKSSDAKVPPPQTVASRVATDAVGGISFGELRKALQDAVAEQQQVSGAGKADDDDLMLDESRIGSVNVGESTVDLLVDNRDQFKETAHDDNADQT